MSKTKIFSFPQIILNFVLAAGCIVALLPFMWIFATSLRHPAESFRMPPSFFPTSFQWENYYTVFTTFPFARFITNSMIVSSAVVVLSVIVSSLAAFSFARIDFKGKNIIFMVFMAGLMIPGSATMISLFLVMAQLGLVGSLWALILPATINPLHIFLMRQVMMTIPKSYEESAEIDGCRRLGIYWYVILPMSKPILILAGLQAFVASWNNFIGPLIFISEWNRMTLPIGLRGLLGFMGTGSISVVLAGVAVSLVVPVLLFVFGQRHFVEGIALTGVKS